MSAADFYKANVGLVHSVSRKGFARLTAARVGIDYEDVFQEMSMVFLKAYQGFDESRGFKFSTYFYMAAYNRLNAWATDMIDERVKHGVVSIDELNEAAGEDISLSESLFVDDTTPEDYVRAVQLLTHIKNKLSPLAGLILEWSIEPPQEVMQQIQAAQVNADYGRSRGLNSRCMAKPSPRYIAGFIRMISDVSAYEAERALKEIATLRYSDVKNFIGA
jgi:RNA polymerase sigma factor (sigma-70 family)